MTSFPIWASQGVKAQPPADAVRARPCPSVRHPAHGPRARLESGRLIVDSPHDSELLNVPSGSVRRVVCFGSVGISAGLRSWALATEVDLVFLARRGSYLGHTWPAASARRTARLRAQLAFADDETRWLPFARAVVSAKVRKQAVLIQRYARRDSAQDMSPRRPHGAARRHGARLRDPRRADGY